MRRILGGMIGVGLLVALAPSAAAGSSGTGPLVQVSGPSPFADCPPADLDAVLPTGEVEPNVAVNPPTPPTSWACGCRTASAAWSPG
jgi:hypothetical protein